MHVDVGLSHCLYCLLKKVEESSIQYSRRVDVAVCVRALQMCAWETSHTAPTIQSVFYACLVHSGQSLCQVLIREIERECTRWR